MNEDRLFLLKIYSIKTNLSGYPLMVVIYGLSCFMFAFIYSVYELLHINILKCFENKNISNEKYIKNKSNTDAKWDKILHLKGLFISHNLYTAWVQNLPPHLSLTHTPQKVCFLCVFWKRKVFNRHWRYNRDSACLICNGRIFQKVFWRLSCLHSMEWTSRWESIFRRPFPCKE